MMRRGGDDDDGRKANFFSREIRDLNLSDCKVTVSLCLSCNGNERLVFLSDPNAQPRTRFTSSLS